MFISDQHAKKRSIQIGDFDASYVEGGEKNLNWLSLNSVGKEWRWQTDLTKAHFGDTLLFKHDWRWVEVNAGYAGMGLTVEDFEEVTGILEKQMPEEIYCDDQKCRLKQSCEEYKGQIPDLKLNLSNRAEFTVKGDDLLVAKSYVDHTGEYLCEILLFSSDNVYTIGSAMLKDYYAVYDDDNYKMALGKVIDFDAPPPPPPTPDNDNEIDDGGDSKKIPDESDGAEGEHIMHDDVKNALIFGSIALVFIIISCIICKKRRDAESRSSGSSGARRNRKNFPLTEDDPNRSLTLGREYPSRLEFVEGSDEEEGEEE